MEYTNYDTLLSELTDKTRQNIFEIYNTLTKAGFQCYLVGGSVRDLLMKRPIEDLDIATDALPEQIENLFRRTIPTGIKHGTITVLINGIPFEVTTFRSDGLYSDGRHPDTIEYINSLSDDLARRDFTVNALAYDPEKQILIDEHNGLKDLKNRNIRSIGRVQDRFFEDGLRPVRACRFCATLDFSLDEEVRNALENKSVHKRTSLVAIERFTDELLKGFRAKNVSKMIHLLEESGLLYLFIKKNSAI